MTPDLVVGVDIGTTATKAVAFSVDGDDHGHGEAPHHLDEPEPGAAVQDPEALYEAVGDAVRDAVAGLDPARVAALSFSSAMHGLLALDAGGDPISPLVTWADSRASDVARELRARDGALALHQRTGTPVHPMSPLVKLAWLRRARPSLHAAARTWGGIKEFVLARATGARVADTSCASGSGLLDVATGTWDPEALDIAGITADALGEPVAPNAVVGRLRDPDWGLPTGVPVVAGGGDGPLANLGVGAVRPGVAACSVGTSGALRVTVERPAVDPRGRVFCYGLADERWVVGGAITNGGLVLDWAHETLGRDVEELLAAAGEVPAGADGLVALPHLLPERAPHWDLGGAAALVGLHRRHTAGHVTRALLEGVCLQLRLVLDAMGEADLAVHEVRATGGFARSPLWRQVLTDALDLPVGFPTVDQGSAFGAALLGMQGVGLLPPGPDALVAAAERIPLGETLRPGPDAARYAARLPLFEQVHDLTRTLSDQASASATASSSTSASSR
ncbi:gluconate kinase (FGGY family) [Actinomycetospora succinea]|uniref:Gluconate kinase (FGGY family) n=1 Tax=Actinomycetospora succinea TaxID=663603 RepID=A0A4R6ULP5_9PSEU|nr:gluconokinase [Actinomycetospora succinea]TDQ46449.1 gluconate kinase (FGGY family) [Actinomycetospora succinea]